jgi:hypothetical protein
MTLGIIFIEENYLRLVHEDLTTRGGSNTFSPKPKNSFRTFYSIVGPAPLVASSTVPTINHGAHSANNYTL